MEQRNEPSTEEIVAALRNGGAYFGLGTFAADLIGRQAREIAALTARAERAERERDAAIAEFTTIELDGLCEVCFFADRNDLSKEECMEDCCFSWRNKKRGTEKGVTE